jgi:hypothetical protein
MPATKDELRRIAELSVRQRATLPEVAAAIGVSTRTLSAWMRSSAYLATVNDLRREWKEQARNRVAGLGEDVMAVLEDLMHHSRNDRVRLEAAQTLGEWLGLDQPEAETADDDRDDLVTLLKAAAMRGAQPTVVVFAPPAPGGLLPEHLQAPRPAILDGLLQRTEGEEKGEEDGS